jgi:hypothetical protein
MTTLLVGAVLVFLIAVYLLLNKRLPKSQQQGRLFCEKGNHYIGNEGYSFLSNGDALCDRCRERIAESTDQLLKNIAEKDRKLFEWNDMSEDVREERRRRYLPNYCPKCEKRLEDFDKDGKPSRLLKNSEIV